MSVRHRPRLRLEFRRVSARAYFLLLPRSAQLLRQSPSSAYVSAGSAAAVSDRLALHSVPDRVAEFLWHVPPPCESAIVRTSWSSHPPAVPSQSQRRPEIRRSKSNEFRAGGIHDAGDAAS